jgi:hypothetical protein
MVGHITTEHNVTTGTYTGGLPPDPNDMNTADNDTSTPLPV